MVDRYCITTAGIYNTSMGEWVKAADYEAFEAKLARVTAYYEGCKKLADDLDAKLSRLVEAAKVGLKRNHIITDAEDFKQHLQGTWVAIPEQNFDHIKAAIEAVEGGGR